MSESETPETAETTETPETLEAGETAAIHMPPNSWWPLVTSFGVTGTLLGVLYLQSNPVVFVVGMVILLAGIGGWVKDARTEYRELH